MNNDWKNQLIFPIIIAISLLYALILKQVIFLLIMSYFFIIICYKKQVTLGLLSFFVAFLFAGNFYIRANEQPTVNQEMTLSMTIFPDTIKVNDTFVTFEGKTTQGELYAQYLTQTDEEAAFWRIRKNWDKEIQVKGRFKASQPARNQHGFSREWYEFSNHKIGTFQIETILAKRKSDRWFYGRKIRAQLIDWVEATFAGKVATYMKALLLGYRDQDFQEIREAYTSSGILHLFSISGMHISIFFGWCFYLFRRSLLTFEEFAIPFILLMFLAVILFGQGISIWRGMLMYLIQFLFKEKQIYWSALDRFSLMLFILLLIEPKSLIQTSGVLSILLSLIILLSAEYQKNTFYYSIEISLLGSPILMFYFYEIPLLGGVLTAIIAPFFSLFLLPSLVILSFLSAVHLPINWIVPFYNQGLAFFEDFLQFSDRFVMITGKIQLLMLFFLLITGVVIYQSRKWKYRYFIVLILYILLPRFPLYSSVTFVDVGQGDSIVLQSFGNREVYVIDTGGKMNFFEKEEKVESSNASYTLIPFLKGEGIRTIDGLFLTHGDFDHVGDLEAVLREFQVKTLYLSNGMLQHQNMVNLDRRLLNKTKVINLEKGQQVGGTIKFDVLAPHKKGIGSNDDSLVLQTKIKGIRFLFMGDLEKEGEAQLLRNYPTLQTDVVKLGHHGSQTSSTEPFIEAIHAKHSIISCGLNNQFKHPHPTVLETLEKHHVRVFRTDQEGMIRYVWNGKNKSPKIKRALVNRGPS